MFGKKDLIKMAGNFWKEESHQLRSHEASVAEPNPVTGNRSTKHLPLLDGVFGEIPIGSWCFGPQKHDLCASHLHVICVLNISLYIYVYIYICIQRCIYIDRYINISLYNHVGKTWSNNNESSHSTSLRGSQLQWDEKPW